MNLNNRLVAALLLSAALTVGCGGGGGSSPGGGIPGAPQPTATPAGPSPTPPSPASAQGTIRDLGAQRFANDGSAAGNAIVGATVIIGPTLITDAMPPAGSPGGDARALTQADGSYRVTGFSSGSPTYVMVFPPAGDPHVSLHAQAKLNVVQSLYLYAPTVSETAELAQINSDRSSNGAGPLAFDEIAFETARAHADFMATNGYYAHCIPMSNCASGIGTPPTSYPPQYSSPNDLYNYLGGALQLTPNTNTTENFVVNVTSWSAADAWFMAEKGTANHGHYDQIVYPSHNWVGLGNNQAPKSPASFGLYIQEFY